MEGGERPGNLYTHGTWKLLMLAKLSQAVRPQAFLMLMTVETYNATTVDLLQCMFMKGVLLPLVY